MVAIRSRLIARRDAATERTKYMTRLARKPYKNRIKRPRVKKTPAERKLLADKRRENREKYAQALQTARQAVAEQALVLKAQFPGHSEDYYEKEILQLSRVAKGKRKTNRWNAFLRNELKKLNDTLPEGAPRYTSTDAMVLSQITETRRSMSDEEKTAATKDLVKDLDEAKEMKSLSVQNAPISAFHDARANLASIFEELRRLYARTGVEIALFAVRSKSDQHSPALTFTTSDRVSDFFLQSLTLPMEEVARRLEAYCLSGVPGVSFMLPCLTRVPYQGFTELITERYSVVLENWPLSNFTAPSSIRSITELDILFNAWMNNITFFRKLTREEFEQWQAQRATEYDVAQPAPHADSASGSTAAAPASVPEPSTGAAQGASPDSAPHLSPYAVNLILHVQVNPLHPFTT
ncbi:hypothetical protein PYCCODRAFT_1372588 [Trametes coccinea BRFM310]|uniref:Uncharacterized protein n=1 Tax=Trametes coccinea (strain BRFM310) TaxID=1353009 RepID=A0A1Y2IF09_TRAC3|nr:hypothetical protein PYCCODRAFT_1372588 [Trametes coccinea BRFM310]